MSNAPRFFVDQLQRGEKGFSATLSGDEAHHALRVLRLRLGDEVVLLDGSGLEHVGVVVRIEQQRDRLAIGVEGAVVRPAAGEPDVFVKLIQALPKGEKMDVIVQKGTEIGVSRFVPVLSERVVVEYTVEKAQRRKERWQRIAREAAKQARRGRRPEVDSVVGLLEAVGACAGEEEIIVLWEGASASFKSVLQEVKARGAARIAVVVGPEGGFSEREAREMERLGGRLATLGPRILRTETAGPVACALVLYELENAGGGR